MSLKNKLFSILTIAVATVAFSVFTFAQDDKTTTTTPNAVEKPGREFGKREGGEHRGFGERRGGPGEMGMLHGINLTDAQKTQIHSILEANKPDQASMEEVHTLAKAKRDGTITADQQARLKTLREQSFEKGKSIHEQIEAVLTPEQKAQIEQRKQEMKQRFENRKEHQKPAPATTDKPKVN